MFAAGEYMSLTQSEEKDSSFGKFPSSFKNTFVALILKTFEFSTNYSFYSSASYRIIATWA